MSKNNYELQPRFDGKFGVKGNEPLAKKVIGFRLPESLDQKLELMSQQQNLSKNELAKQLLSEILQ